ncbi:MAG: RdgB/HAM1 family non-canonical purine NTP pyrophosphatase [Negativicutes bacterium]|nr:RdgB/HAM1 family non-canonical purine NTP pyrophosphatase [Negativicutes bacterium]
MTWILLATGNRDKVREFSAALADIPGYAVMTLDCFQGVHTPEETEATIRGNAVLKAVYYFRATGYPCLADDTGLEVDALGGAPGVMSARFAGPGASYDDNNACLLRQMAGKNNRRARFRTVLALAFTEQDIMVAEGVLEGIIGKQPRGSNGFGYDPLFYLPDRGVTLAELTTDEKNRISHRAQAVRNLIDQLRLRGM